MPEVKHRHGHALAAGGAPRLQGGDALLTGEGPHAGYLRVVDLDGLRVLSTVAAAHIWRQEATLEFALGASMYCWARAG